MVEIAETSCHRICGPPNGDLLVLYGLEMKYKGQYFLAAVFFASYLLVSRGVPLLPVLAGCVVAAFVTWWRLAPPDPRGRQGYPCPVQFPFPLPSPSYLAPA